MLVALAFQADVIQDYQLDRLTRVPRSARTSPRTSDYNLDQSLIAVGSGGLFGRGYLAGTQTNLDYVPEQHTDFIFTVVGEEFGFVGAAFVLLLFALLIWRAIRIAYLSKDPFGTYVAAGIASMFAIQMFVNVGMVIGIMPITGIPLPFLSYGGSAMLANFIAVGMLESIHMRRFKLSGGRRPRAPADVHRNVEPPGPRRFEDDVAVHRARRQPREAEPEPDALVGPRVEVLALLERLEDPLGGARRRRPALGRSRGPR